MLWARWVLECGNLLWVPWDVYRHLGCLTWSTSSNSHLPAWPQKTVSRHCQNFSGKTNSPILRTIVLGAVLASFCVLSFAMICTLTPSARRMDFHYQRVSIPWAFPCFHLETIEFKTLEGSFRFHLFKIPTASILNLSFKCKLAWKDQVDEGEKGSDVIFLSQPCIRQLFKLISNPSPKRQTYSLFFLFSLLRTQYLAIMKQI